MNIIYSNHARIRMKQRGINEFEVEDAIYYPDYIRHIDNKKENIKDVYNRRIRVIYKEIDSYKKIITVI